ncbi:MAG: S8 family peptidase [Candidatus Bipolaricaulaceae bacterium]
MTRWLWVVAVSIVLFTACAWCGPERLDPLLRALAPAAPDRDLLLSPQVLPCLLGADRATDAEPWLRVIVRTRDAGAAATLPGFLPSGTWGRLATGRVTPAALTALADHPQVVFVEAARPVRPLLDVSVPQVGAPSVWAGHPGGRGAGAMVGIVDSGIDPLHPDFRVDRDGDGSEESSRIAFLWDQTLPADGTARQFGYSYGQVYSQDELTAAIAAGVAPSSDTLGHGTHVTGIAAGDGSSSDLGLVGVAPQADLVVVKTDFYQDQVLDGVDFAFQVAEQLGRPVVVNLSLGGHGGPHDGTSLFEQSIDAQLDRPARAVVVAAGNEAGDRIHVGEEVRGPTTWHLVAAGATVSVHLWHPAEAAFAVEVAAPGGEELRTLPGAQASLTATAGYVWVDNTFAKLPDPRNGAKEIFLTFTGAQSGSVWEITLEPFLAGGRVDGWVEDPSTGHFQEGNAHMTVAEPGNARRVITAGAYVTKTQWTSAVGEQSAGEPGERGQLTSFSSRGPTRDGRIKPDLAAPGAWIASALSAAAAAPDWLRLPDGSHWMMQGTSMAAPHAAGVCALLMSADPTLSWDRLRRALTGGARADGHTGATPNPAWGWGKLDAAAAVETAFSDDWADTAELRVSPNPAAREARFFYCLAGDDSAGLLSVYDLTGRLVFQAELDAPTGEVAWDLHTPAGRPVASGLYLAVVVGEVGPSPLVRVVVQR